MKPLYLKRIALKDFRSFASLDIELPDEPSVLIVHGSNGLGKSSLFDSLEWVLSDSIDHFRDASGVKKTGSYLCRWREGENRRTSAAMQFSDGSVIERSLASPKAVNSQLGGTVSDIIEFLRSPNWVQPISELQRYLLLTHFLGQSTFSRLTYRNSTERFDILKEAARSTDIDAIANSLHGQGHTLASRAYSRKIEAVEREIQNLEELLTQETSLFSETQISGAIDSHEAALEARRVLEQLDLARLNIRTMPVSVETDADFLTEKAIATLEEIEEECLSAEKSMAEARRLSEERIRTQADIADIVASHKTYKAHAADISRTRDEARSLIEQQRLAITEANIALAKVTSALSTLRTLSDARGLIVRLENELHDHVTSLKSYLKIKAESERAVAVAERRNQLWNRVKTEIRTCEEQTERLRGEKATIEKIILGQEDIARQTTELAEIQSSSSDLKLDLKRAEQDADAAISSVISQQSLVDELRLTIDETSRAIAILAIRLPAGACECPLCDTRFDNSAMLNARVSSAAQRLAPTLTAQEIVLKDKLVVRDQQLAKVKKLKELVLKFDRDRVLLESQQQHLSNLVSNLEEPDIKSFPLHDRKARLDGEIVRFSAQQRRKLRWLSHPTLDRDIWISEQSRVIRARDSAQRSVEGAIRASDDTSNALKRAHTEEDRALNLLGPDHGKFTKDLPKILIETEGARQGLTDKVSHLTHMQNTSEASVALLESETKGLNARLAEMAERRTKLEEKMHDIKTDWRALKQFGEEPDMASVDGLSRRVLASRHVIQATKPQLARLREGRFVWARQSSHSALLEQIRGHLNADTGLDRDQLLVQTTSLLSRKRQELEDVIEVKRIAKDASAEVSAELTEFSAEYIKPLGHLMSQLNQAILCDPRVGIGLHVKNKKIEQSAIKGSEVPKGAGNIDPMLVHSEGQMAALAVSMLCAASLTFPWSRWKALVLDDPLQHNDSIHVAAFADLMANLISSEGYQVLISTHDIAQAEFLQRKFSSRRIPCRTLSLLGQGTDGVKWSIRTELSASSDPSVTRSSVDVAATKGA